MMMGIHPVSGIRMAMGTHVVTDNHGVMEIYMAMETHVVMGMHSVMETHVAMRTCVVVGTQVVVGTHTAMGTHGAKGSHTVMEALVVTGPRGVIGDPVVMIAFLWQRRSGVWKSNAGIFPGATHCCCALHVHLSPGTHQEGRAQLKPHRHVRKATASKQRAESG